MNKKITIRRDDVIISFDVLSIEDTADLPMLDWAFI